MTNDKLEIINKSSDIYGISEYNEIGGGSMKFICKKRVIGWLVGLLLVFGMILTMSPDTVSADDATQTVYIGGNELTVPAETATYWKYNESDGTITSCASETGANVIINAEDKYDDNPASSIYINLKNVNIKAPCDNTSYYSDAGIYSPNLIYLRINGECSITGSQYGVYSKRVHITPFDTSAKLTITVDSSLAPFGFHISEACALYSTGLDWINAGRDHKDFSVILKSDTHTVMKGGGKFMINGTNTEILTSKNMDGSDVTEYLPDADGKFNLGDMSEVKYKEYRVGTRVFDSAGITGVTLNFKDGDAPVFTAQVIEGDEDKYGIWSEQWSELDEDGNKVKWCSSYESENPDDESKLLKTFEAGKTYCYSVTIMIKYIASDSFTEKTPVTINGETFMITNKALLGDYSTIYATNIKSITIPEKTPADPVNPGGTQPDKPDTPADVTPPEEGPKAGADGNLYVWILMLAASMVMTGCVAYRKCKNS